MGMGGSETPVTAVDHAADAGLRAIENALIANGARACHVLILVYAEGQPEGEPNSTLAGQGYEDGRELLAELLTHAHEVGAKIGVDVNVISAPTIGQG